MDDDDLVMAIPARELFQLAGFTSRLDVAVLGSIAEEAWFARPDVVQADLAARAVWVGVFAERQQDGQRELLIDEEGRVLHTVPVTAQAGAADLAGLRRLAQRTGAARFGQDGRCELAGGWCDHRVVELRGVLVLVYRMSPGAGAIGTWISPMAVAGMPLSPLCRAILPACT